MPPPERRRRGPWLILFRPANVVTALGDVLAGYGISQAPVTPDLLWLLVASACLYAGGVALNDVADRHLDRIERPERPLPSGRISASTAAVAGAGLLVVGVLAASLAGHRCALVAAALALSVLVYDIWAKSRPMLAPFSIGSCRALNLLLGMAVVPGALSEFGWLALLPLVYVGGVSVASQGEVHGARRSAAVAAFAAVAGVVTTLFALTALAASKASLTPPRTAGPLLTLVFAGRVLPPFWRAMQEPDATRLRRAVRAGILGLVWLNAGLAAAYADIIYVLVILLTGAVAGQLARRFAVT